MGTAANGLCFQFYCIVKQCCKVKHRRKQGLNETKRQTRFHKKMARKARDTRWDCQKVGTCTARSPDDRYVLKATERWCNIIVYFGFDQRNKNSHMKWLPATVMELLLHG